MFFLGIDLETTGLDPSSSEIIEIGYMVWDSSLLRSVTCGSYLIKNNYPLPEEIKKLTGITDNYLSKFGIDLKKAVIFLSGLAKKCDFLVGHNTIEFDRKYLSKTCKKYSLKFPKKYWIDTIIDLPYPKSIKTRKLDYLAVEHDIYVKTKHRAIFDIGLPCRYYHNMT